MKIKHLGKRLYYTTRDAVSDRKNIEINDVTVTFPSYFIENFSWTIESERPILNDLLESIEDNDSFYDIGAHAGLYSTTVGSAIDGDITAFEPYPPNINRLNRYLSWNQVDAWIVPYALSDKTTDTANLAGEMVEVDSRVGDDLIQVEGIPVPDVVKIDVEGAELSVIRGLEQSLRECRLVYCEIHPDLLEDRNISPSKVTEALEKQGFKTETIVEREQTNVQPILRAERTGEN
jgi:FkbM family methyltransferase